MLFLLPFFALCDIKLSNNILRLPFWVEGSPTKPFQLISADHPNVEFKPQNEDLISVEKVNGNTQSRTTVVKVSVKYNGKEPIATEIYAMYNDESSKIQVYIDRIDHVIIRSNVESLYVNSFCRFKAFASNKNNIYFTSLNGVELEWGSVDVSDRPFDLPPVHETPFKTKYLEYPPYFIILKPTRVAETILTVKLPRRDEVPVAKQTLRFVDPICFYPREVYLMPNSVYPLHLYQAYVNKNNDVVTNHEPSEEIDLTNNVDSYSITSSKNETVTVTKSAIVTSHEVGSAFITARDLSLIVSVTSAEIVVRNPDSGEWPAQWIKWLEPGKEKDSDGPYEPDTTTIKVIHNDRELIQPKDLKWQLSDSYQSPGKHKVTAKLGPKEDAFFLDGTVYTCPPPSIDPSEVRIPLGHDGYEFLVKGGSGFFDYEYSDELLTINRNSRPQEEKDGIMITANSVTPLKEGDVVVKITDQKLKGYQCQITIHISKLVSVTPDIEETEIYVGSKLPVVANGYDINNNRFDYVMKPVVEADDPTIIDKDLTGLRVGFTYIEVTVDETKSAKKLISVINYLDVCTPIKGSSLMALDLGRKFGPVRWENAGQTNKVACGDAKVSLVNDDNAIIFEEDFNGECTLTVQNEVTEVNRKPILAEIKFSVVSKAISHLGLFASDENAVDDISGECGLIGKVEDITSIKTDIYVPFDHKVKLTAHAFGKDNTHLARFNVPGVEITARPTNESHSSEVFTVGEQPFAIKQDLIVTVNAPKLPQCVLNVHVVNHHYITEEIPFILYKKNEKPTSAAIKDGSGFFELRGSSAEIDGRTLRVFPNSESSRKVYIADKCIPENKLDIIVKTESAASLSIEGPNDAVMGQTLEFTTSLLTKEGKKISPSSCEHVVWSGWPEGLKLNKETGKWEITVTEPGRLEIEITADDIRRTHGINVYKKMEFRDKSITMFVGEKRTLKVVGGPDNVSAIRLVSSNSSVVSVDDNQVATAHTPGSIDVIATVPENPNIATATVHIRVLDARDLILKYDAGDLFVGSYVHIQPFIETDNGPIEALSVGWTVDGNENYMKLHDNSLIVQGEKEGTVIVTAQTPQHLMKTIKIYFDYKLKLLTPDHIKIPLGSTYQVQIENNLNDVQFQLVPFPSTTENSNHNTTKVNEEGVIDAQGKGRYVLFVVYKQQWQSVSLTVTEPVKMFCQSEAAQTIHLHTLDPDHQEYTSFNNSKVDFTLPYPVVKYNESYTFDVPNDFVDPVLVNATISIDNFWAETHHALLYPRKLIYPPSPIIQLGARLQLTCQAPRPNFVSLNDRVATVTSSGLVTALNEGKTIIQCTPEIETTITVIKYESVTLEKIDDTMYKVNQHFSTQSINTKELTFADDIYYRCEWDATECGKVSQVEVNGEHFCRLEFYPKRLCPTHSYLEVQVESATTNLRLKGGIDVKNNMDSFLITPTVTISFSKYQKYQDISLEPAVKDDIILQLPKGVEIEFIRPSIARLSINEAFDKQEDIIFEHRNTGERVRVTVIRGKTSWSSIYLKISNHEFDKYLFYISVVLTISLAIYVVYNIEEGQLLLPYSPYRNAGGKHPKTQ